VKTSLSTDLIEFDVLKSLLTGPKGVSEIAKEFNVGGSIQDLKRLRVKVSRILKKLKSEELVAKDSDGRYRLTVKGFIYTIFNYITGLSDEDFQKWLQQQEKSIGMLTEIEQTEDVDELVKVSVKGGKILSLRVLKLWLFLLLYKISLNARTKHFENEESLKQYVYRELDRLWPSKLKPLLALLTMLMSTFDMEEWKKVITSILIIDTIVQYIPYYEHWLNSQLYKSSQT